jgi:hypothetical protein
MGRAGPEAPVRYSLHNGWTSVGVAAEVPEEDSPA